MKWHFTLRLALNSCQANNNPPRSLNLFYIGTSELLVSAVVGEESFIPGVRLEGLVVLRHVGGVNSP